MKSNTDILIATSSNYLLDLITNFLNQKGYDICGIATSKQDLFNYYKELNPSIVILDLDINKDKTTIFNFISKLLSIDSDMLIIAIGDDVSDEFKNKLISLGVCEYLCKPFQPAHLWERVARIINIHINKKQNKKTNVSKNVSRETTRKSSEGMYLSLPSFEPSEKQLTYLEETTSSQAEKTQFEEKTSDKSNLFLHIFNEFFKNKI